MRKLVLPDRPIWPSIPSSPDPVPTDPHESDVPLEPVNVRNQATEVPQKQMSSPRSPSDLKIFGSFSV